MASTCHWGSVYRNTNLLHIHFPKVENGFEKKFPDFNFSPILAETPRFPLISLTGKSSKFSLNSLIGGNPVLCRPLTVPTSAGRMRKEDITINQKPAKQNSNWKTMYKKRQNWSRVHTLPFPILHYCKQSATRPIYTSCYKWKYT